MEVILTRQPNNPFSKPQYSLEHEVDKGAAEEDCEEGDGYVFLQVADGGFVASEIAFDELQVATVGAADHIEDIAHEEGDEADENVPQRVVDDGKGERDGFCHEDTEDYEWERHERRNEIADAGWKQKAKDGIQIIGVHPPCNALQGAVET